MDAKKVLQKLGGGGKKQKGLPKRHRNPVKKLRNQRSQEKLAEKKARHVLRSNGARALRQYELDKFCTNTIVKAVCARRGIEVPNG
jgi:hypothetical protein